MASYKIPVLVWEDQAGYFTASMVEDEYNSGFLTATLYAGTGQTADQAIYQVKEYLSWDYDNRPWRSAPDFLDAKLVNFKVEIRPEYKLNDRVYPCDLLITLRVPCVHGRQESGLLISALPTIGLCFYYYEAKSLKDLVIHYVQERLKGHTPQELSRYLPPKSVKLEEITLQVNQQKSWRRDAPTLPALTAVSEPIGDRALRRRFGRAWEREAEIADLIQRILKERANVILLGETGVGKTALLAEAVRQAERELARQKSAESDEEQTPVHKFWLTSGARLIAGMQYLGQWEARCERLIEELSDIGGVLCVENLLDLVRTGGSGVNDSIASFILPYLQRGELRLIAEATPAELDACRRLLPGFADLFQILSLPIFTRDKAVAVLARAAESHKRNLSLTAAPNVVDLTYRLFNRFIPYQAFPGKTVQFLNDLFERVSLARETEVTTRAVIDRFIKMTGLPELFLRDEILLDQHEVLEFFRNRVIGQEEACQSAASLVTTFKASLNDPNRPVGVLLFCGPTGVGKTELARAISSYFFGHGDERERLVRLDMSEYAGPGSVERILGETGGEPSELIKKARRQPFMVLLLDEIEKADASIFDLMLSLFDEGRLTDRYGRTTIFRSAVIIMTSNLGADKLDAIGFGKRTAPSYAAEAISFFRAEFFNRIDAVVRFNSLDIDMVRAIAKKELAEVSGREGITKANLRLQWPDELIDYLVEKGFDARYGARPLQRTIETIVIAPLAHFLVAHPGLKDCTIKMALNKDGTLTMKAE